MGIREDRGGGGVGVRETRERKGREIRVLKGWEVGEIRGNHVTMPNTLQSKKRMMGRCEKKGAGAGNAWYMRRGV